jgi:hypothetical protein
MNGMTKPEIKRLLHQYIGVGATGIVEGLSYKALKEKVGQIQEVSNDAQ